MRWLLLSSLLSSCVSACGTDPSGCVPSTCPGCCVVVSPDGLMGCNPGTSDSECGSGAETCTSCRVGLTCRNQRCLPPDAG